MSAAVWLYGGWALVLVWGHLATAVTIWTRERSQRAARARLRRSVRRWRKLRDGQAQRPAEPRRAVTLPRPVLLREALHSRRRPLGSTHLREAR